MNLEPSLSGKALVGLIIPPPDIRAIVDKTASFVARNGVDFENKIKEREMANIRFNFLSPADPYHAYYKGKIAQYESGEVVDMPKAQLPEKVVEHIRRVAEFVPKEPPAKLEFMDDPCTVNAFDLELIRLTALFTARNGRQFLTQLMSRENTNVQFDFLKPQHSNFGYFTKMVEQYTKVIMPSMDNIMESNAKILEDSRYRAGWGKYQRKMCERENAEAEQERKTYSQIDWDDLVVVQTVDFQPSETLSLPPPCTPSEVGTRILNLERADTTGCMDMDVESDEEDQEVQPSRPIIPEKEKQYVPYAVTQPAPAAPSSANVIVRDYDPKKARATITREEYVISPLTHKRVLAGKLQDHVHYSTVDPLYKKQRDREQMERQEDVAEAAGTDISGNIARLAERRTDIFGTGAQGAEQTIIGKKLGEEEGPPPNKRARDG